MDVQIAGAGLVGLTCAQLLVERAGDAIHVSIAESASGGRRVVVVSPPTQRLLESLWNVDLESLTPTRRLNDRKLAWHSRAVERITSPAIALDVDELRRSLRARLDPRIQVCTNPEHSGALAAPRWTVLARGRPVRESRLHAGARVATEAWLEHDLPGVDDGTLLASVSGGWLFATPRPDSGTALTLVSPPALAGAASLRAATGEVWESGHVADALCDVSVVPCAPQLETAGVQEGWLCVGDAVLSVDPLCGDGIGFGLRGALLAAAVIGASRACGKSPELQRHYRDRLVEAFRAHVGGCVDHYERAFHREVWETELCSMRSALSKLGPPPRFAHRLVGRELCPVAPSDG